MKSPFSLFLSCNQVHQLSEHSLRYLQQVSADIQPIMPPAQYITQHTMILPLKLHRAQQYRILAEVVLSKVHKHIAHAES
jgi:hypothetical protein